MNQSFMDGDAFLYSWYFISLHMGLPWLEVQSLIWSSHKIKQTIPFLLNGTLYQLMVDCSITIRFQICERLTKGIWSLFARLLYGKGFSMSLLRWVVHSSFVLFLKDGSLRLKLECQRRQSLGSIFLRNSRSSKHSIWADEDSEVPRKDDRDRSFRKERSYLQVKQKVTNRRCSKVLEEWMWWLRMKKFKMKCSRITDLKKITELEEDC